MTAVEWLFLQLYEKFEMKGDGREMDDVLEQAKKIEKEQIIDAYNDGFKRSGEGWNGEYGIEDFNNLTEEIGSEEYYKETYGKE